MTDDIRAQLLDLPGAPPDDVTFDAIVTAGRRRRRQRRAGWLAATAAIAVAATVSTALALPGGGNGATFGKRAPIPATASKDCRQPDVTATLGPGQEEISPVRRNTFDVRIVVKRNCELRGPLRLETNKTPGGWQPVPDDPNWTWPYRSTSNYGGSGPQQTTSIAVDRTFFYVVDLGWRPRPRSCPGTAVRLVGASLVLPLGRLSIWCGEPIAVSNTFAVSQIHSIDWTLVQASGTHVKITYRPQCRGVVPRVIETSDSVTIAALVNDPIGPHGCLNMTANGVSAVVVLHQPLGSRDIRHAPLGPWPAADFISAR